jgi:hypothetical protein
MSTMSREAAETSVSFSLAELAKLEEGRLREEAAARARARDAEARVAREREAEARALEAAAVAREAEARAAQARDEARERARAEARAQAAVDVARIEAEAKARLEADNAARAHELALLRARTEGRGRVLVRALAAALGLALAGGAAGAYTSARRVAALTDDAEQLRAGQRALSRERDAAKGTELAALDRRHGALRARAAGPALQEARATAEAARSALDPKTVDHDRLRSFGDALDALEARIGVVERVAALDRRRADLAAWAAERRRTDVAAAAKRAEERAKEAGANEGAVGAYERALDELRDALAHAAPAHRNGQRIEPKDTRETCDPTKNDPLCGLDGRRL